MKIVRQNADELVLESKSPMVLLLIGAEIVATIVMIVMLAQSGVMEAFGGLAAWSAVVIFLLAAPVVLGYTIPRRQSFAFHRGSRRVLAVDQYLLRTKRNEFRFDDVQSVTCETAGRPSGIVTLNLTGGRRINVLPNWSGPASRDGDCHSEQIVAIVRKFLGLDTSEANPNETGASDQGVVEAVVSS